jgi:hypothetical protein
MARRGSRALAALAVTAVLCGGAADGATYAERVSVNAKLSFERKSGEFTKIRLTIKRNTTTWRSGPLGTSFFGRPRLYVSDLDADGEHEVRLNTYTRGAHCCFQTRFFRWLPARRAYGMTFRNWADTGYRAVNLDRQGAIELLSGDARFGYVFTAFAASRFPIQIWEFAGGRLRNVTRLFPGRVELDAKRLWRTYREHRRKDDVRGVLAAWQADQYLLGHEDAGWLELERALKRGDLQGPNGFWPTGRRYLRALRAFLVKTGYA